jgi:hypothetical protein
MEKNEKLILSMNALLNDLMKKEIGSNESGFLPHIK